MAEVGTFLIKLKVDDKGSITVIDGAKGKMTGLKNESSKAGESMSADFNKIRMGAIAFVAALSGVALGLNKAVNAASNLEEATSKFDTVFEGMGVQANAWSKNLVENYAMSTRESKEYLSSIQDLLVPMGMVADKAGELTNKIVQLSADLGSLNNLQTEQVIDDIKSALVGNYETVKKYGTILNETVIKQEAMNLGLWNGKGAIDANIKAELAYNIIAKSNVKAQGDMNRTAEQYANTKKRVAAKTEDVIALFGAKLIPVFKAALLLFEKLIIGAEKLIKSWDKVIDSLVRLVMQLAVVAAGLAAIKLAVIITSLGGIATAASLAGTAFGVFALNVQAAMLKINAAIGPIGWVAIAVGALVTAFKIYEKQAGLIVDYNTALVKSFGKFKELALDYYAAKTVEELEKLAPVLEKNLKIVGEKIRQYQKEIDAGERESTNEAYLELINRYDNIKNNIAKIKQAVKDKNDFQNELEGKLTQKQLDELNKRKDYEFETNRITLAAYMVHLNNRLAAMKKAGLEESLEYMKLADAKNKIDSDLAKRQTPLTIKSAKKNTGIKREAQEQETIDTAEALNRRAEYENEWHNKSNEEQLAITSQGAEAGLEVAEFIGSQMQDQRNREAEKKRDALRKEVQASQVAAKKDLDTGKITQKAYDLRLKEIANYESNQTKKIEQEQKKRSAIEKTAAISRTIISTYEMAVKAFNSLAQIPVIGTILGAAAAIAATVFGFKQVQSIRATGYEEGGEFDKGQMGYIEGTAKELIAPKKTFVEVIKNMMVQKEIDVQRTSATPVMGAESSKSLFDALGEKVDNITTALRELDLRVDAEGVALAAEAGNKQIAAKDW